MTEHENGDSTSAMEASGARPILRDERGRVLPGTAPMNPKGRPPGSGARPRAIDLARDLASTAGIELEDALRQVFAKMLQRAAEGDTQAARIVMERLVQTEDQERESAQRARLEVAQGPPVPQGRALANYYRELARVYRESADRAGDDDDGTHREEAELFEMQAKIIDRREDLRERSMALPASDSPDPSGLPAPAADGA